MRFGAKILFIVFFLFPQLTYGELSKPPKPSFSDPVDYVSYCNALNLNKPSCITDQIIFDESIVPNQITRHELLSICKTKNRSKYDFAEAKAYLSKIEKDIPKIYKNIDKGIYFEIHKSNKDDGLMTVPRFDHGLDAVIALIAFELQKSGQNKNLVHAWKYSLKLADQFEKTNILVAQLMANKIRDVVFDSILCEYSCLDSKSINELNKILNEPDFQYTRSLYFQWAACYEIQQKLFDGNKIDNKELSMFRLEIKKTKNYLNFNANIKYMDDYFNELEKILNTSQTTKLLETVLKLERKKGALAKEKKVITQKMLPFFSIMIESDLKDKVNFTGAKICLALKDYKLDNQVFPKSLEQLKKSKRDFKNKCLKDWVYKGQKEQFSLKYKGYDWKFFFGNK